MEVLLNLINHMLFEDVKYTHASPLCLVKRNEWFIALMLDHGTGTSII